MDRQLPPIVGRHATVLFTTLLMATLIVSFDFVWYTVLAVAVSHTKRRFDQTRLARWLERISRADRAGNRSRARATLVLIAVR